MITRIVKLTFKEQHLPAFISIWNESKKKIIAQEGCHFAEMMQSRVPNNVCFTYSVWDTEDALNKYRHSELFEKVWSKTKVLFDDKPQAWTTDSHSYKGSLNKNTNEED